MHIITHSPLESINYKQSHQVRFIFISHPVIHRTTEHMGALSGVLFLTAIHPSPTLPLSSIVAPALFRSLLNLLSFHSPCLRRVVVVSPQIPLCLPVCCTKWSKVSKSKRIHDCAQVQPMNPWVWECLAGCPVVVGRVVASCLVARLQLTNKQPREPELNLLRVS